MYFAGSRKVTLVASSASVSVCHTNTIPHKTTGYTAYYVMFGHHPRLAVDFLLGIEEALQDMSPLKEWIQTYQVSLKMTQEHVSQRSEELVCQLTQNHNDQVNDSGFEVEQFVYLQYLFILKPCARMEQDPGFLGFPCFLGSAKSIGIRSSGILSGPSG